MREPPADDPASPLPEPTQDVGHVMLDGLRGDEQPLGDLCVRQSFCNQRYHLSLPTAEHLETPPTGGVGTSPHAHPERAKQGSGTVGVATGTESFEDGQTRSGLGGRGSNVTQPLGLGQSDMYLGPQPGPFAVAEFAERRHKTGGGILALGRLNAATAESSQGTNPRRGEGLGDRLQARRRDVGGVDVTATLDFDQVSP